jgi:hypothetical protein
MTQSRAIQIRERDIERACVDLLQLDGWRPLKTDPCSDRFRGKGFGERGMGDSLLIRYAVPPTAEVLWIEWKGPRGRVGDHQMAWHMNERARGAKTLIASIDFEPTIDGFLKFYRTSGLMRRPI